MPDTFSVANTSCVPKFCYQSMYRCLIQYFLVRMRAAKYFTNSGKLFRYEVIFENEDTSCSWVHHVLHLHSFCAIGMSRGLATRAIFSPELTEETGAWQSILRRLGPASVFISVEQHMITAGLRYEGTLQYMLILHLEKCHRIHNRLTEIWTSKLLIKTVK
jgi:hypothetical protein